jgi:putative NIF3 family GTP cyclohydrolase 1 type 2
VISSVFSREKNVIRLNECTEQLRGLENLNQKYQIHWQFVDGSRQGIHVFDYPLLKDSPFVVSLKKEEVDNVKSKLTITVEQCKEDLKDKNLVFRLQIQAKNQQQALVSGKTVANFKNKLTQSFEVIILGNLQYMLTIYIQNPEEKVVYAFSNDWLAI